MAIRWLFETEEQAVAAAKTLDEAYLAARCRAIDIVSAVTMPSTAGRLGGTAREARAAVTSGKGMRLDHLCGDELIEIRVEPPNPQGESIADRLKLWTVEALRL